MFFDVEAYEKNAVLQKKIAEVLIAIARPPKRTELILDVGAGTGFLGRMITKKRGLITHAIDVSETMLSFAKPHYSSVFHMDVSQIALPFKYDMIISSMCLQWVENQDETILRIMSHLKKWGKFYFALPLESSLAEINHSFESLNFESPLLKFKVPSFIPIHVEEYIETYPDLLTFLKSFNKMGIKNASAAKISKEQIKSASRVFPGIARWEIGFFEACFFK
jgi:SAM-dependent methyltransferase